jgi:hypothetical protein
MPLGLAGAQYRNTSLTKQGDLGSQLPPMPSQATWRAGTATLHCTGYDTRLIVLHACAGKSYEVGWTVQANHGGGCDTPTVLCCWGRGRAGRGGGGSPCAARADVLRARLSYAYRMAPLSSALTEQDFRKMPLDMVGNRCGVHPPQLTPAVWPADVSGCLGAGSILRWDGNRSTQLEFNSSARGWQTDRGTVPPGSVWRKNPIPPGFWARDGPTFEPVCRESQECIDSYTLWHISIQTGIMNWLRFTREFHVSPAHKIFLSI